LDATGQFELKSLSKLTGISSFKEIRENGLYYVDKTELLVELARSQKHSFLSRPRRFGKTLVVSVLEHLFLGHESLFKGLYAEKNWDWKKSLELILVEKLPTLSTLNCTQ
jgi:hypothetical protein